MNATSKNRPELHAGWEAALESDERLVWKGHSDGAVVWTSVAALIAFFGLMMIAGALLVSYLALSFIPFSGSPFSNFPLSFAPYMFTTAALFEVAAGVFMILGPSWLPAYQRKRGLYILTNKRAIIMTNIPLIGNKTSSHPIAENTILEFDSKDPGSIYFSGESEDTRSPLVRLISVGTGFERIPDAAHVYQLLRSVQRGDA